MAKKKRQPKEKEKDKDKEKEKEPLQGVEKDLQRKLRKREIKLLRRAGIMVDLDNRGGFRVNSGRPPDPEKTPEQKMAVIQFSDFQGIKDILKADWMEARDKELFLSFSEYFRREILYKARPDLKALKSRLSIV